MLQERQRIAVELLLRFAEHTGLTGSGAPRRYLWTDAFAVCSFLGLTRVTGDGRYERLALRLVDRVHHTLGRHRLDDPRAGWISGLSTREGEAHPTRGGLRIGKELIAGGSGVPNRSASWLAFRSSFQEGGGPSVSHGEHSGAPIRVPRPCAPCVRPGRWPVPAD